MYFYVLINCVLKNVVVIAVMTIVAPNHLSTLYLLSCMQNCGRNLLCDHPLLARLRKLLIYGVSYDLTWEFQWIVQGDCSQPNKGVSAQKAREFQPGRQGSFSLASQGSVSLASQGSFSVASS